MHKNQQQKNSRKSFSRFACLFLFVIKKFVLNGYERYLCIYIRFSTFGLEKSILTGLKLITFRALSARMHV